MTSGNRLTDDLDHVLARTEPLWHDLRGERIVITGATGFFGCWLLESFAWANRRLNLNAHAIAVSRHPETLRQRAPHLAGDSAIQLHAADVRDGEFPRTSCTHVIHAAAEASAALNDRDPQLMFDTIVEGTRRVLQFGKGSETRRFLFVSSGAVYGKQPPGVSHVSEHYEGGPDPLQRSSAYAEGKRAAESLCALSATSQLDIVVARCFAFVGPYMQLNAHFAIGNFIADALRGTPIQVKGDGSPFRSYLYAADLAVWLWTLLFRGQSGRAYNVGSEDSLNIASVANEVASACPRRLAVQIASVAEPGVPAARYVPSTARARRELGLTTEISVGDAIRRTLRWFKESRTSESKLVAGAAHA